MIPCSEGDMKRSNNGFKAWRKENRIRWEDAQWDKHQESIKLKKEFRERKTIIVAKEFVSRKTVLNKKPIELNSHFELSHKHHVDSTFVIYIPISLHRNAPHSLIRNRKMNRINLLAWDFLESTSY